MEIIYIVRDKFDGDIAAFESRETARQMQKELLVKGIQTTIHPITLIKK